MWKPLQLWQPLAPATGPVLLVLSPSLPPSHLRRSGRRCANRVWMEQGLRRDGVVWGEVGSQSSNSTALTELRAGPGTAAVEDGLRRPSAALMQSTGGAGRDLLWVTPFLLRLLVF